VKSFDAAGLAGSQDAPGAGRPHTYPMEQVSKLVASVLAKPTKLGLPFATWTLDPVKCERGN